MPASDACALISGSTRRTVTTAEDVRPGKTPESSRVARSTSVVRMTRPSTTAAAPGCPPLHAARLPASACTPTLP
ncbi:hypothetical protein D3C75_1311720 [compost metagenome]